MKTSLFTLLGISIMIIMLIFSFYFLIRNNKVYEFRTKYSNAAFGYLQKVLNSCVTEQDFSNYYVLRDDLLNTIDKYSYDQMLYSFKSLKLENWFSKEEIKYFINEIK